ncbi:MAG: T9SS type A sorting domain-containing protein [Fibrobacteres bacterium]|nr:T9SS type A sorting domain-containing protein [Fibrobacterota bacterium]
MILAKFVAFLLLVSVSVIIAIPAFPGAEGWGANSLGGRGGKVIHVTKLTAGGTGSLAAAVAVSGPKIIVFDTGGVIDLMNQPIRVSSYTTIAGQTAPGGITLKNGGVYTVSGATNVVVRHIRVRRSADMADGDCMRFENATDCIFDHMSGMWCSDEILDFVRCARITVQYTSISEPGSCFEKYGSGAGYGNTRTGILGNTITGGITLYRCLLSDHSKRSPYLSNEAASSPGQTFELINNFFYNCAQASGESFDNNNIPLNLVSNYYKIGRNTTIFTPYFMHKGSASKIMRVHATGNYHHTQPTITKPSAFFDSTTVSSFVDTFITPRKTTNIMTAQNAMQEVFNYVGPFPRDNADHRVCTETQYEDKPTAAAWMVSCAALNDTLMTYKGPKIVDTDKDGMSDSWETTRGFNPNDTADYKTIMPSGYMAIEAYINELSDTLVARRQLVSEKQSLIAFAPSNNDLQLTPNPFSSTVTFMYKVEPSKAYTVAVWNLAGQCVFKKSMTSGNSTTASLTWNGLSNSAQSLPAGNYMVTVVQGKQKLAKRLALIR